MNCIVDRCRKKAVPCIKGWTDRDGLIIERCLKHEKEWHDEK